MYDTSSEDGVSFAKELTSEDKGEFKIKKDGLISEIVSFNGTRTFIAWVVA